MENEKSYWTTPAILMEYFGEFIFFSLPTMQYLLLFQLHLNEGKFGY